MRLEVNLTGSSRIDVPPKNGSSSLLWGSKGAPMTVPGSLMRLEVNLTPFFAPMMISHF